jgi:hypothetical protein
MHFSCITHAFTGGALKFFVAEFWYSWFHYLTVIECDWDAKLIEIFEIIPLAVPQVGENFFSNIQ